MTLRTRTSPSSGATSGPGRPHASDGRDSGRIRGRVRGRPHGRPPAPPSPALRRRAERLVNGPGAREAPPDVPCGVPGGGSPGDDGLVVMGAGVPGGGSPGAGVPRDGVPDAGERSARPAGWRLALGERMPVWVQARCGLETKTLGAVAVVLVAAVGFAGQRYWSAGPEPVRAPSVVAPAPALATGAAAPHPAPAQARIGVDVGGKVSAPGIRRLPAGSRVEDALAAAGGVRPGTDTSGLNRARVLMDGEQVLVGAPPQNGPGGPGAPGGPGPSPGPVSLASATVEQLDGLPGVGPVLARHIVDYRTARGGFRSVEELRQVNGIGERRFADLRALVRL
ncbi:helix-hairpin-helix domain-containing protein [Streptomyces sp. G-G2]|uniref:helix-hairpin-helix domain-containing protein n=1 Tax=Streptomyces sp. G-G2 TaxID=3046201 RepID=UPI0024BACDF1|nr:helix-hairpin-helix domain-containing protein [Streptomyces sp. G-G2]MDJ0384650.1 helix-hairpin-helix domain-containing protein [Streptomyces sp. G-G2]